MLGSGETAVGTIIELMEQDVFNDPRKSVDDNQPTLDVGVRHDRQTYWFNAHIEKRRRWLGFSALRNVKLDMDDQLRLPNITALRVDDIDMITDQNLRYALRFKAAASSAGWVHGEDDDLKLGVEVTATDEGFNSRLLEAQYGGRPGDFEQFLHDARQ